MKDALERAYRAFDPAPLSIDNQEPLYVNLDKVRGNAGLVDRLANRIRLSDKPTCQVIAGHRGSGKTTELVRLHRALEDGDSPYFVVFCESDQDVDRNDIDFPDVLIAIMRQMAAQLKERVNIKLSPGYFRDRLKRLKNMLASEVSLEDFELQSGLLNLAGTIKSSPDAREEIRKQLEPDTSNWLNAANDVIGQAKEKLRNQGYEDLVIVVDDLDKMVLRTLPESGRSSAEYLFIDREAQLSAFKCHLIYTMPLALAYSAQEQNIANLYGARVPVVPMTKVYTRPPEMKTYSPGTKALRDLIRRRLSHARIVENDVFKSDQVIRELIKMSGGQPRELMILMREALIRSEIPVDVKALQHVQREVNRAYGRQLQAEHWEIIEAVRKTGRFERTADNESVIRDLLDSRALLQYVNDDEWYAPNPLLPSRPKATADHNQ